MFRKLVSTAVLSAVLAAPAQAQYVFAGSSTNIPFVQLILNGSVTVTATDQGYWRKNGTLYSMTSDNTNYFAGRENNGSWLRNFFLFSVPTGLTISSATLRLNSLGIQLTSTYRLFDFLGNTTVLGTSAINSTDATAFDDLGAGVSYGSRDYSSSDINLTRDIALNGDAVSALSAARGGQFAMGGRLDTDPNVLATVVPEPATYFLMGAGLAALFVMRRRRAA